MIALVATIGLMVASIGLIIMLASIGLIQNKKPSGDWLWIVGMTMLEGGVITIVIDIGIGLTT